MENNITRGNSCPVACEHYSNDTGLDDEYFFGHCDLASDYETLAKCPLGLWEASKEQEE